MILKQRVLNILEDHLVNYLKNLPFSGYFLGINIIFNLTLKKKKIFIFRINKIRA